MKLNELIKIYGNYEVKEGFLNFLEKPKPKTVWDLQVGDTYYFLDAKGKIYGLRWDDDSIDNDRRANRRCYLTEQDAEFSREQEKVIAEMERLGGTKDMMSLGDTGVPKYFIGYEYGLDKFIVSECYLTGRCNTIYFATKEEAQNAIDEIGEDRIKKYIFYVKDGE